MKNWRSLCVLAYSFLRQEESAKIEKIRFNQAIVPAFGIAVAGKRFLQLFEPWRDTLIRRAFRNFTSFLAKQSYQIDLRNPCLTHTIRDGRQDHRFFSSKDRAWLFNARYGGQASVDGWTDKRPMNPIPPYHSLPHLISREGDVWDAGADKVAMDVGGRWPCYTARW